MIKFKNFIFYIIFKTCYEILSFCRLLISNYDRQLCEEDYLHYGNINIAEGGGILLLESGIKIVARK